MASPERAGPPETGRQGERVLWVDTTPRWEDLAALALLMAEDHTASRTEQESIALTLLVGWCREEPSDEDADRLAGLVGVA